MGGGGESLQSIRYERGSLRLLDQRKLPLDTIYLDIQDAVQGWEAIRDMVVRGAPAIAIALSLSVEISKLQGFTGTPHDAASFLKNKLEYLVSRNMTERKTKERKKNARFPLLPSHRYTPCLPMHLLERAIKSSSCKIINNSLSRPTAVNLSDAATKLTQIVMNSAATAKHASQVFQAYIEAAEIMLEDDVASNKAIGSYGSSFIQSQQKDLQKLSVLTHCNTGSLATAGYGTALGVICALHADGVLESAYCTETRPFNQGSRLTAFELVHDKIPATLIADSAAAALMKAGRVHAVVVGADRVAANGDTANKIGTYSLALSAKHHGVLFYVAAPLTSVDLSLSSGEEIVIEERSAKNLLNTRGGLGEQVAATGISVWNPAFDVTPANLINGTITEKGVITKNGNDYFDIKGYVQKTMSN